MGKILDKKFYNRNTLTVAKELLGKFIVRKIGDKKIVGKIVEVEAYNGPQDLASHASRGKTERNAIMFGHPGFSYVYMIYGMYYCFNIVTEDRGFPAAVLVRAVEMNDAYKNLPPLSKGRTKVGLLKPQDPLLISPLPRGSKEKITTNGPGKFCRAFKIDKKLNGMDITKKKNLWVEDRGKKIKKADMVSAKRIGVDYAKEYKNKLWRFYLKGSEWVSRK